MDKFFELMRSTKGATAIEYGLIVALIFIAAVTSMTSVGTSTSDMWNKVSTTTNEAVEGS